MAALAANRRREANASWFAAEADRLARLCGEMAERFARGGRLLATGDVSDSRHVAVEFVHPVIVGKRALPALAVTARELALHAEPDDMVIGFGVELPATPALVIELAPPETTRTSARSSSRRPTTCCGSSCTSSSSTTSATSTTPGRRASCTRSWASARPTTRRWSTTCGARS